MIEALRLTFAEYFGTDSVMLGKKVPEVGDIEVTHVARRLRASAPDAPPGHPARRLQDCSDDNQRFRVDAPQELGLTSCSEAAMVAGSSAFFCDDQALAAATRHCRSTC